MPVEAALIHRRLAQLPGSLALHWPGGQAGPAAGGAPAVVLKLRDRRLLLSLMQGRIGDLGDAYVRGDPDPAGHMPDLMVVAGAWAHHKLGNPTQDQTLVGAR
jgi:hypothetical protein